MRRLRTQQHGRSSRTTIPVTRAGRLHTHGRRQPIQRCRGARPGAYASRCSRKGSSRSIGRIRPERPGGAAASVSNTKATNQQRAGVNQPARVPSRPRRRWTDRREHELHPVLTRNFEVAAGGSDGRSSWSKAIDRLVDGRGLHDQKGSQGFRSDAARTRFASASDTRPWLLSHALRM